MEKNYGKVFFRLRKENNMTQEEVARKLNITQRTYAHYEKGTNEPSIDTLIKLADIYRVPIDILVGRYEIVTQPTITDTTTEK